MPHPPTTHDTTTLPRRHRRGRVAAALSLVALLGLATACGEVKDDAAGVATLDDSKGKDDDTSSEPKKELTDAERQDAMLEFAACMREHGVDMPDPQISSDGKGAQIAVSAEAVGAAPGSDGPDPEFEKKMNEANEACEPIMKDVFGEAPEMSPEDQAKFRDEQLAYAKCMRENGVDMPDPEIDFDGGKTKIKMGDPGTGPAFDPQSPTFKKASEACQSILGDGGIAISGPVSGTAGSGDSGFTVSGGGQ